MTPETSESVPAAGPLPSRADSDESDAIEAGSSSSESIGESPARKPTKAERRAAKANRMLEAEKRREVAKAAAERGAFSRRLTQRWVIVGSTVLALLLAAVGVLAVLYVKADNRADRTSGEEAVRASALSAAQTYATDFGTFSYKSIDKDFANTASHLTPEFAKEYESTSSALKSTIMTAEGNSKADVRLAGIVSLKGTTAVVIVFLDQSVTSSASKTPVINRNRMQLTLERQKNGTWLISNMQLL